jgi:hypothetical protein
MCDRISNKHGYICDKCFEELSLAGDGVDFDEFMESNPGDFAHTHIDLPECYEEFELR